MKGADRTTLAQRLLNIPLSQLQPDEQRWQVEIAWAWLSYEGSLP